MRANYFIFSINSKLSTKRDDDLLKRIGSEVITLFEERYQIRLGPDVGEFVEVSSRRRRHTLVGLRTLSCSFKSLRFTQKIVNSHNVRTNYNETQPLHFVRLKVRLSSDVIDKD